MIKTRLNKIEKLIDRKTPEIDYSDMRIVKFIFDEFLQKNDIEGLLLYFAKIFLVVDKKMDNDVATLRDREFDKLAIEFLFNNKPEIFNRIFELARIEIAHFETDKEIIKLNGETVLTKTDTEKVILELCERGERIEKCVGFSFWEEYNYKEYGIIRDREPLERGTKPLPNHLK